MAKVTITLEVSENGVIADTVQVGVDDTVVSHLQHLILEVDGEKKTGRLHYTQSRCEGIWDVHSYGNKADMYAPYLDQPKVKLSLDEEETND